MKKLFAALCLTCVLSTTFNVYAADAKSKLDAPVSSAARQLVKRGAELADADRTPEAIIALKKAIALAPNYVNAHAEYIRVKAVFQNRYDEARAEYEALMAKEPNNPVYPMALAVVPHQTSPTSKNAWYKRVIEIAPEWTWAHYAGAMLAAEKEPETAAAELLKFIEADGSLSQAYFTLSYIQEKTLKRIDDAIQTAEKMAVHPDFKADGLSMLWRLRLGKAGGSQEEKARLRAELSKPADESKDIKVLNSVRLAFSGLLEDKETAKTVESKMRLLDSTWYPERGKILFIAARNISGVPRLIVAVNRQFAIFNKASEVTGDELEPKEKLKRVEQILAIKPSAEMKRYIYEQLFKIAAKADDLPALIKYGQALHAIDKTDAVIHSKIALALIKQKKDSAQALQYARQAEQATRNFNPVPRPANCGLTDDEWRKERFTEARQQEYYKKLRSQVLDALGWALCQSGDCAEGEMRLRESVALHRSEQNLGHLSVLLGKLGKKEEAEKYLREEKEEYARVIKTSLKSEPAQDFELTTIEGNKVKLSDLKGKVVLVDFWATWCGPCISSVPTLNSLYEKYKEKGFEILYVSVDSEADLHKIAPFKQKHKIGFPVLLDGGAKDLYSVKSYPTNIFIDKDGKVRYRSIGFDDEESARMYDTIISLLLETDRQENKKQTSK